MEPSVREFVRRRAEDRCEYCRLPQLSVGFLAFHIEHVIARQHGGSDEIDNLAWACHRCNAYKGPNISSIDELTLQLVPLFHPRRDQWPDHFQFVGASIVGLTPVGRATVKLLGFNDPYRVELREQLSTNDAE